MVIGIITAYILKEAFFDFDFYKIADHSETNAREDSTSSVLVFVYEQDYETQKELLGKIIAAIGLQADSFKGLVLLKKGEELNANELTTVSTSILVAFGIAPSKLGFNAAFKAYRTYRSESYSILLSHSLQKLSTSKEHKMALWSELQKEFA